MRAFDCPCESPVRYGRVNVGLSHIRESTGAGTFWLSGGVGNGVGWTYPGLTYTLNDQNGSPYSSACWASAASPGTVPNRVACPSRPAT